VVGFERILSLSLTIAEVVMPLPTRLVLLFFLLLAALAHAQQSPWRVIARPNTYGLFAVDFVDTLHGWCAGQDTIYRTTDGGITWRGSSRPFGANAWNSISFSDTLHGWAVGRFASNDGLTWRTTDGGITWTEQQFILSRIYRGTFSHSANRNTTSGYLDYTIDTGLVVRTTNAGGNWQEQRFNSIRQLGKVMFVDSLHGWITTGPNFILRTVDGGVSWLVVPIPVSYFAALTFIDTLHGWAGVGAAFFQSTDGGLSWQFQYEVPFLEDFGVEDVSFVDSLNGWGFGETAQPGIITEAIYRTTTGGTSWYRESVGLTSDLGGLGDGIMLDAHHGWAVAADGRVLRYRLVTSVAEKLPGIPSGFTLRQNYPNPFNPTTTIEYELLHRTHVRLTVHDLMGKVVETLVDETEESGIFRVTFNAARLASGSYFYTLETPEYQETKQLLLVK
jgi:photosystem II stability/assembly factor-like uncharacterized protein